MTCTRMQVNSLKHQLSKKKIKDYREKNLKPIVDSQAEVSKAADVKHNKLSNQLQDNQLALTKGSEDVVESNRNILTLQRRVPQICYDVATPQISYDGETHHVYYDEQSEPALRVFEREQDDGEPSSSQKSFVVINPKSTEIRKIRRW